MNRRPEAKAGTVPQPTSSPTATTVRGTCRQAPTSRSMSASTRPCQPGASAHAPARSIVAASQEPTESSSTGGPPAASTGAASVVSTVRHQRGRRARCSATRPAHSGSGTGPLGGSAGEAGGPVAR